MKLSDLINPDLIFLDLNTSNKEALLSSLINNLCLTDNSLKNSTISQLILNREKLCSTALDNYVAIPHARVPGIPKTYACIGICEEGIDFGSIDEFKTKIFVLILQPEHTGNFHLEILKSVANMFRKKNLVNAMLNNRNKHEIYQLIKSNE
jgi:PTS system nitrogen regulatory IIA component